jgi:hypothetical protein
VTAVDQLLVERGWEPAPGEICSLDCTGDALHKRWHHSEILLCERHALVLEAGRVNATYSGAPLPPETRATEWPWIRMTSRVVSVV